MTRLMAVIAFCTVLTGCETLEKAPTEELKEELLKPRPACPGEDEPYFCAAELRHGPWPRSEAEAEERMAKCIKQRCEEAAEAYRHHIRAIEDEIKRRQDQ